MKYALNLAEDNRILSACVVLEDGYYDGMPIVEIIPDGNVYEYRFADGEYIHDPLPEPSSVIVAPRNIMVGEYITLNGVMYMATTNIPNGEPIITGQNAIETTIEEKLVELAKGE